VQTRQLSSSCTGTAKSYSSLSLLAGKRSVRFAAWRATTLIHEQTNHSRFGELSLRQQRLSMRMLNVFKTPTVRIRLSLVSESGESLPLRARRRHACGVNQFVSLRTQVDNLSGETQRTSAFHRTDNYSSFTGETLVLALSIALSPVDYVLVEGVLTDIPIGRLGAGESHTLDMGMCFVAQGKFDAVAEARALGSSGTGFRLVGSGESSVLVGLDSTAP